MALLVVIALSVLGVIADVCLKRASLGKSTPAYLSRWFFAGALIYALTSFGWVMAMRRMTLASIGAIYCVMTVLLLAFVGVAIFNEPMTNAEILGISLALISILLLARFA